jgi:hypothetical protein
MNKQWMMAAVLAVAGAAQATDVGVSIGISQPGVYGRIDIGRFPQPAVVVAQPVIVHPPRMVIAQAPEPVYMWVPPGHRKNWRRHCANYGACGAPVVFVRDQWYHQHVAPMAQPVRHEGERGHGRGHGHGKRHE